jgi:hypothetical protein
MDGIAILRSQALQKRNATILAAKREYTLTLKEITTLQRRLNLKSPKSPRSPLSARNVVAVAREILAEGTPMSTPALTLEVQRRGCRSFDDPRDVGRAIRAGLRYHRRKFRRGADGRWGMAEID